MGIVERFGEYAQAFEKAYENDDWSVLEPYFTEDAVYDFVADPPLKGRHEGRAAMLKDFKELVDGFDRRFVSRRVDLLEGPLEKDGAVWARRAAIYTLDGAPEWCMEGEERAVFEGDRIKLLEDKVPAEGVERLNAYLGEHGGKMRPAA